MISIKRAISKDAQAIVDMGTISVEEAHRGSCSAEDLNEYLRAHYNQEAISKELDDPRNIYQLLFYEDKPAGFSKIVLNEAHENIEEKNVTKLDRIYLLKEFFNKKLGAELLNFNIELAKLNGQAGIWLFTWEGNLRAINFYTKAGFQKIGMHHFQVTESSYNLNHHMYLKFCV